jgi:ribosomal peptide maturation radical SAM protein 1
MPPIGLGILKAALSASGLASTIYNLNLDLLPELGDTANEALTAYELISCRIGRGETLIGEWLFTRPDAARDERYLPLLLEKGFEPEHLALFHSLRPRLDDWIHRWARRIVDGGHDIVGFSCSFDRTRACARLAGAIRSLAPGTRLIAGGFSATGDMGLALLEAFEVFDLVCHAEGDDQIVPIVRALRDEPGTSLESLRGVSYRTEGRVVTQMDGSLLADIERSPLPEYDDYFEQVKAMGGSWEKAADLPAGLPLETSRGCWWGSREHCTFCSLNGERITFRSRSPERILTDIDTLHRKYGTKHFNVVDNILDDAFYTTLFPRLGNQRRGVTFSWEVRPNLGRDKAAALAQAGVVHVQPGIESLSTPALRRMRKGTSAIDNLQALKWLTAFGVKCQWNFLTSVPGEELEWYEEVARLIPRLVHLPPPREPSGIAMERFSPLFARPSEEGVRVTGPTAYTRLVFHDVRPDLLDRLSYDFEHEIIGRPRDLDARIRDVLGPPVRAWREAHEARGCTLSLVDGPGESLLVIGPLLRPERILRVRGLLRGFLKGCESICREQRLLDRLAAQAFEEPAREPPLEPAAYRRLVEELGFFGVQPEEPPAVKLSDVIGFADERGWVYRECGRILSLPVDQTRFVKSGAFILQESLRRYVPS